MKTQKRKYIQYKNLRIFVVSFFLFCNFVVFSRWISPDILIGTEIPESDLVKVYEVNKRVSEFIDKEDLSSPEKAYVVINRLLAKGEYEALQRISTAEIIKELPTSKTGENNKKDNKTQKLLNTKIIKVMIYSDIYAAVVAKAPEDTTQYDVRFFKFDDGEWLNYRQNSIDSLDDAYSCFAFNCALTYRENSVQPKIEDPESYIKTFIDFLKSEGKDPTTYLLDALKMYKVVIMAELHHRPLYWYFNSQLVTQPDFSKTTGTIYLELPCNNQNLVNKFLMSKEIDQNLVIEVLRDYMVLGCPDQAMLDFFTTVWMVNQKLPDQEKIRMVLVDAQRPWDKINEKIDWEQYSVDRNIFMAENIQKDIEMHPGDNRNSIFITGGFHAMLDFEFIQGYPFESTGWFLRRDLGAQNVFSIIQHAPVMTNTGVVLGRRGLGLFDSTFAELGNKPIAFPLAGGPFGEQAFDAFPNLPSTVSLYRDVYSAYLYLGPLEYEIVSPLIAGFYTDDFVQEIDRRYRVMYGESWSEKYELEPNSDNFITWVQNDWGKPYSWRNKMGPLNAWENGNE